MEPSLEDQIAGLRECVQRERKLLDAANAECLRLRKALRFYRQPKLYETSAASISPDDGSRGDAMLRHWDIIDDGGERARKALAGKR